MKKEAQIKEEPKSLFSDEDWKLLLPGKEIQLGSKTLTIEPVGLEDFANAVRRILSLTDKFKEAGITRDNFSSAEKLPVLADLLISNIPDVISLATNIPVVDLKRLPLSKAVELVNLVLDVNLESQEGLEKNLQMLVGKIQRLNVNR